MIMKVFLVVALLSSGEPADPKYVLMDSMDECKAAAQQIAMAMPNAAVGCVKMLGMPD